MGTRERRIRQNDDRRGRTEVERTHRRSFRTPKNVGTKTFGGREPSQIFGCEANRLSSCTQRLLGTYGHAEQTKANLNK